MKKLDVKKLNGEKVKDLKVNEKIFGIEPNDKVLRDAIILTQASLRQGTHKTKNRSEVRGGGRKPWRQKGTGRARQGSVRAVQWVGGGVAFGPTPRSYSKKQNRKERRLALLSAYAHKFVDDSVICVDSLKVSTPKTKEFVKILKDLDINDKKVLVVVDKYDENIILSSRNLRNVLLLSANEVSVLDLVDADVMLVDLASIKSIEEVLK